MHSVASGMETGEYCISRCGCTGAEAAPRLGVVMDQALILLRPGVPDASMPPGSAFVLTALPATSGDLARCQLVCSFIKM